MTNLIAIFLVIGAIGMLIGYQLGFSAGKKEGYEQGRQDGKQAGSVRAFAVGYDRGRHDREVQTEDGAGETDASGLRWRRWIGLIVVVACLLSLLSIMRGGGLDFRSLWKP